MDSPVAAGGKAVEGAAQSGETTPRAFSRKASGLIRQASALDVFNFNIVNAVPGLVLVWMFLYVPSLYPGASIPLTALIVGVIAVPMVATYARLSAIFPRSGADYVYNSRVLHPSIGFGFNVGAMIGLMVLVGQAGVYTGGYGVGPLLRVEGLYFNNSALVSAGDWLAGNPWGLFVIGVAALVAFGLLFMFTNLKAYFRVQVVLVTMGMLSLLILLVSFLLLSRGVALANIDHVLVSGGAKGIAKMAVGTPAPFSWAETIKACLWAQFGLLGSLFSCYIGGEVKSPGRAQTAGMLGCLAVSTIVVVVVGSAALHLLGSTFFANLGLANPSALGISATPTFVELGAMAVNNWFVALVILVCFSVWGLALIGASALMASRCVFAWSLDRIIPGWFSSVSRRWHTTYAALTVVFAVGFVGTIIFAAGWLTPIGTLWAYLLAQAVTYVSAMILPWRKRDIWQASPEHAVILGIPRIFLLGLLAFVANGFFCYFAATDSIAGITPGSGLMKFGFFFLVPVIAIILYFVSSAVQRRRGLDISLNFAQIPPE